MQLNQVILQARQGCNTTALAACDTSTRRVYFGKHHRERSGSIQSSEYVPKGPKAQNPKSSAGGVVMRASHGNIGRVKRSGGGLPDASRNTTSVVSKDRQDAQIGVSTRGRFQASQSTSGSSAPTTMMQSSAAAHTRQNPTTQSHSDLAPFTNNLIQLPSGLQLEASLAVPHQLAAASKLAICLHPWSRLGGRMNDSCVYGRRLDGDPDQSDLTVPSKL